MYPHLVNADDVTAQWAAAQHSQGLSPVETVTATDPGNHTLTYRYDPLNSGRELSQTDGTGATTTFGYDSAGFQDQIIDPDGDFTDTGYDIRGNVVATTTCQSQATFKCSTSYTTYTDPALIGAWGTQDEVKTTRDGRSSSATDNTYLTTDTFDSMGDLISQVTPSVPGTSNPTTTYVYTDGTTAGSADGSAVPPKYLLYKTTSPNNAVTYNYYDADGNLTKTVNPDNLTTTYKYDGIGRKISQTVTSDTYPNGLTTTYSYDADNRVVQETDPAVTDRVTGTTHIAQITTAYDVDGNETSQATADIGTPSADRDPSRTETWTYNGHDQKKTHTDGAAAQTQYTYDAYGNQQTQTDAAGNVTAYTHDADGRLQTTTLENYTGSPAGSQAATNLTEESRAYDLAGRLSSVTDAMGRITAYTYTDDGLTASVTQTETKAAATASGLSTPPTYAKESDTYDAAGNLITKTTDNGATTTSYSVDAGNRVTSQSVDPSGLNRVTSYTYDPDDHVLTQSVSQGGNPAIQQTSYTYDKMGDKTSQQIASDTEGPTGWWNLVQGSGPAVADDSGTGNTATATSGVTWSSTGARFTGQSGQDITTRGPVVDTTGSYSVSAWVNLAAVTGNDEVVASQDAGSVAGFYLGYDPGDKNWAFEQPEADENDPPTFADATASTPAQTGTWVFLTGVYDINTGSSQLYVNGALSGSATDTSPIVSSGPVEIGASKYDGQTGTGPFDGTVNSVETYPFALSASEVGNLYGQGKSSNGTGSGDLVRGAVTTDYQVDELGQVSAETSPDGATTDYQYDEAGHQSEVSAPRIDAEKNGAAPVTTVVNTYTGYDTFGDIADTQDANGNDTYYTYDGDGRQLTKTLPPYNAPGGSTAVNGVSQTHYNALGEVDYQIDPDLNKMTFGYDQLGDQTNKTDVGTGGVTSSAYDTDKELLTQTNPTLAETASTWDFLGRQVTSSNVERYLAAGSAQSATPATYTTVTSYATTSADPSGTWKSSVTTPGKVTTAYGYDAAGEQTQVTDGASNTTTYGYDALGRQIKVTNPGGTYQTTTYDPVGNVTGQASYSSSGGTPLSTTSATFNGEGKQLSSTDADGNTSSFTYNAAGDLTAETQPVTSAAGIVTSFGYDASGNQTRYTDGNGVSRYTTYNSRSLAATQVEPPAGTYTTAPNSTTTLGYDGDGNITSQTEPGGVTQTYTYDSLGDVKTQSGSGATATTAARSFTYNNDGEMTGAATSNTAASGQPSNATSETFAYNDRGLVDSATGSAGTTSLLYNGDGRLQTVVDPAGTSSYAYDTDDRLKTMADPATGTSLTYTYNAMSQPSKIAYGSGDTQTYGYNTLNQLASDTLANGSTTVASITYTPDLDGNLTKKVTTQLAGSGTSTYTYDKADRLTSWNNGSTTTGYVYDNDGNRTQAGAATFTYDARDELVSDGTSTYGYTANGDLTTVTNASTGTITSASTSDAYGQQAAQGAQTNTYDATGRDVQLVGGSTTTNLSYLGTGGQLVADGTATYTWTPSGTLTATAANGSGTLDLTDQHTDVVGQFTANATSLTGSQTFGPWGTVTATGGTRTGSLGYQSQYTSSTTGQTDMGARWYNPAVGGFDNKDTVSNKPTPNSASASPFGYAADNPLDATDPSGHATAPVCQVAPTAAPNICGAVSYPTPTPQPAPVAQPAPTTPVSKPAPAAPVCQVAPTAAPNICGAVSYPTPTSQPAPTSKAAPTSKSAPTSKLAPVCQVAPTAAPNICGALSYPRRPPSPPGQ